MGDNWDALSFFFGISDSMLCTFVHAIIDYIDVTFGALVVVDDISRFRNRIPKYRHAIRDKLPDNNATNSTLLLEFFKRVAFLFDV